MSKSNDDYKEFGAQYGDFPDVNDKQTILKNEKIASVIERQKFKDEDYAEFGAQYGDFPNEASNFNNTENSEQ